MPFDQWEAKWRNAVGTHARVWVATRKGLLVGYASLFAARPDLSHVVVDRAYRRQGIGGRLLDQLKLASPDGLTLMVGEANVIAQSFYVRNAFIPGERRPHHRTGAALIEHSWGPGPVVARSPAEEPLCRPFPNTSFFS